MKRTYGEMTLYLIENRLSVLFPGTPIRRFVLADNIRSKVSCVLRRPDPALAGDVIDYLMRQEGAT